jgi:flavin reductase (DIM6/NTAB) family NADH-FMN oxidoreductase RutF
MIDGDQLRRAMGHFATGVAVAATRLPDGTPVGLTCNSLTSVSLDPPLVLFCVDRKASSLAAFLDTGVFALSLLGAQAEEVSWRFALGDPEARFDGLSTHAEVTGAPVLEGALAWLDCTVWRTVEAGDHVVIFGGVEAAGHDLDADPLVYFRGAYRTLGP